MKKSIKITESQYNRIFLNEQSNSPKEYDCIKEKYGDKGSVIQFDTRKSYIIKNNNNDRLYFLEDKSFFYVKKGQGWRTEGQYSCADKKYKIKNKEGGLFEYIDNFLKSPKRLPEPTSNSVEDEDVDYGGCVKGTYLEGVVKSILQNPFSGLERKESLRLYHADHWKKGNCTTCYSSVGRGNIITNICFSDNRTYFVESTTNDDNIKFKPNDKLLKIFSLPKDLETSYISYMGVWDTDDVFVGDKQKITLKIGQFKLQHYKENGNFIKYSGGMMTVPKAFQTFSILFNYFIGNKSVLSNVKPLDTNDQSFYDGIKNKMVGMMFDANEEEIIYSLNQIENKFKNYTDYRLFDNKVIISKQHSLKKIVLDNANFYGEDWRKLEERLKNIFDGVSPWSKLPQLITDIENWSENRK
tara:strand:+ start:1736 stop:2971 length:1236 start_codon:yes stop_codon:yes gene_type:complete